MARRRRKGGRKMPIYRKVLKTVANTGAGILVASPVIIPAYTGIKAAMSGGDLAQEFVYDASGYNLQAGALDTNKLGSVATRDAVLVIFGLALRWAAKRV